MESQRRRFQGKDEKRARETSIKEVENVFLPF
jgi:hypothetical protein